MTSLQLRRRVLEDSTVGSSRAGGESNEGGSNSKAWSLRKFPSTSTLDLDFEKSSTGLAGELRYLKRRKSLPEEIWTRERVELLVKEFGFSDSLARFIKANVGIYQEVN